MANPPTTIGATIKIRGEFESAEDVSILGNISGEIETSADIFVETGGSLEASVRTRNIDVRGKVIGNIEASDRFEIHDGGSVTGDVKAPRVILSDGAKYKGHIDMVDTGRRASGTVDATPTKAPATTAPTIRRK